MWNGKCNLAKENPNASQTESNLNIRNGQATDTASMRSVSSEDISTSDLPTTCCNSNATNPAIKSGRRFQLLQVGVFQMFIVFVRKFLFIAEKTTILTLYKVRSSHRNLWVDLTLKSYKHTLVTFYFVNVRFFGFKCNNLKLGIWHES